MIKKKPVPISAARIIAKNFGYDQVIIIARKVGDAPEGGEHCTTYGVDKANCDVAASIGDFLKFKVMGWVTAEKAGAEQSKKPRHDIAAQVATLGADSLLPRNS